MYLLINLKKHSKEMRQKFEKNPDLFTIPIGSARFHNNCRDEAPKLLKSLQVIFIDDQLNRSVFSLLSSKINTKRVALIQEVKAWVCGKS